MFLSPNHPRYAELIDQSASELLLTLDRTYLDQAEELRLTREQYQGNAYLSLRVFRRGPSGWEPYRPGVTIRSRELRRLGETLIRLAEEQEKAAPSPVTAGETSADPCQPRFVEPRRRREPQHLDEPARRALAYGQASPDFDELEGSR